MLNYKYYGLYFMRKGQQMDVHELLLKVQNQEMDISEAEEYLKSICEDYNEEYERTGKRHYFVGFDIKNAYLASAEPREKRITELEKELEQAKKVQVVEHFEAYGQCRDSRRITSLEQENAELKRDKERLTQAKEIIRRLMDIINHDLKCFDTMAGLDVKQKAEQFLKETKDIREDSTYKGDWIVDEH